LAAAVAAGLTTVTQLNQEITAAQAEAAAVMTKMVTHLAAQGHQDKETMAAAVQGTQLETSAAAAAVLEQLDKHRFQVAKQVTAETV
jgi:hypothetical protein